jgi:hypothetical protein
MSVVIGTLMMPNALLNGCVFRSPMEAALFAAGMYLNNLLGVKLCLNYMCGYR